MNSDEIRVAGIGASIWLPFNLQDPDAGSTVPQDPGVYIIRASKLICRAKGESDIAYIGKATGALGLWGRAHDHLTEPSTTDTSGRVRQWLEWRSDLQLGYIITEDADTIEKELLRQYDDDHFELPPINRAMG